jgi:hypothetical protein
MLESIVGRSAFSNLVTQSMSESANIPDLRRGVYFGRASLIFLVACGAAGFVGYHFGSARG